MDNRAEKWIRNMRGSRNEILITSHNKNMATAVGTTRSVVFSFGFTVVGLMACVVFSCMLKLTDLTPLTDILDVRFRLPFPSHTLTIVCKQLNIHCMKSKFYLFSIAITRTHILVGMQHTLNNLYTNGTLDILNGSLEIWFYKQHKNSVGSAQLKQK